MWALLLAALLRLAPASGAAPAGSRVFRAGVWQGAATSGDIAANLRRVHQAVKFAAAQSVELLCFPELFLQGYDCSSATLRQRALQSDALELQAIGDLARTHGVSVCVPFAEVDPASGHLYNAATLFDCHGAACLHYRKVNLAGGWERGTFSPAPPGSLAVAEVTLSSGIRLTCGIAICMDLEFPEPARTLAMQGAELLLVPTALGVAPTIAALTTQVLPTRAMENNLFVLYANLEGDAAQVIGAANIDTFCGQSALLAPDGSALVRAGERTGGTLLSAEVELDSELRHRASGRSEYLHVLRERLDEGHYAAAYGPR